MPDHKDDLDIDLRTSLEEVWEMRKKYASACALPDTSENREKLKELASEFESGYDGMVEAYSATVIRSFIRRMNTEWYPMGRHLSVDFKMEHHVMLTPEELAKGPVPGKTWYIRSNLPLIGLLPGIPYIHIPGFPVYPLFRVTDKPW